MKHKCNVLFSSAIFLALTLAACGDDVIVVDDKEGFVAVDNIKDEKCSKDKDGTIAFESSSNTMYVCSEGKWISTSGQQGCAVIPVKDRGYKVVCDGKDMGEIQGSNEDFSKMLESIQDSLSKALLSNMKCEISGASADDKSVNVLNITCHNKKGNIDIPISVAINESPADCNEEVAKAGKFYKMYLSEDQSTSGTFQYLLYKCTVTDLSYKDNDIVPSEFQWKPASSLETKVGKPCTYMNNYELLETEDEYYECNVPTSGSSIYSENEDWRVADLDMVCTRPDFYTQNFPSENSTYRYSCTYKKEHYVAENLYRGFIGYEEYCNDFVSGKCGVGLGRRFDFCEFRYDYDKSTHQYIVENFVCDESKGQWKKTNDLDEFCAAYAGQNPSYGYQCVFNGKSYARTYDDKWTDANSVDGMCAIYFDDRSISGEEIYQNVCSANEKNYILDKTSKTFKEIHIDEYCTEQFPNPALGDICLYDNNTSSMFAYDGSKWIGPVTSSISVCRALYPDAQLGAVCNVGQDEFVNTKKSGWVSMTSSYEQERIDAYCTKNYVHEKNGVKVLESNDVCWFNSKYYYFTQYNHWDPASETTISYFCDTKYPNVKAGTPCKLISTPGATVFVRTWEDESKDAYKKWIDAENNEQGYCTLNYDLSTAMSKPASNQQDYACPTKCTYNGKNYRFSVNKLQWMNSTSTSSWFGTCTTSRKGEIAKICDIDGSTLEYLCDGSSWGRRPIY